ncbi:MAG TPA: hypothetical protein VEP50_10715 [bacterium]|nr:hypothetical protein [bacterium]
MQVPFHRQGERLDRAWRASRFLKRCLEGGDSLFSLFQHRPLRGSDDALANRLCDGGEFRLGFGQGTLLIAHVNLGLRYSPCISRIHRGAQVCELGRPEQIVKHVVQHVRFDHVAPYRLTILADQRTPFFVYGARVYLAAAMSRRDDVAAGALAALQKSGEQVQGPRTAVGS